MRKPQTLTITSEYIFGVRGVVNRPTMSGQSAVYQRSKEVGDLKSSALTDTDKPPPLRRWVVDVII